MIRIDAKDASLVFQPHRQPLEVYKASLENLMKWFPANEVVKVTASGGHLQEIIQGFDNIPKPGSEYQGDSFIWTSVFAETIVANILNSLYNGDSFIIKQVKDVHEYAGNEWYRKPS